MPTETIPFEVLGHFEEIIDIETGKCYGTRPIHYRLPGQVFIRPDQEEELPEYPPAYGYAGRVQRLFKKGEVIQIDKAHKGMQPYKFKANAKCWIITHPLCGKMVPR